MIHFYDAEESEYPIVAHGDIDEISRRFKITEEDSHKFKYACWKAIGAKYFLIGFANTIETAKLVCNIKK